MVQEEYLQQKKQVFKESTEGPKLQSIPALMKFKANKALYTFFMNQITREVMGWSNSLLIAGSAGMFGAGGAAKVAHQLMHAGVESRRDC